MRTVEYLSLITVLNADAIMVNADEVHYDFYVNPKSVVRPNLKRF